MIGEAPGFSYNWVPLESGFQSAGYVTDNRDFYKVGWLCMSIIHVSVHTLNILYF